MVDLPKDSVVPSLPADHAGVAKRPHEPEPPRLPREPPRLPREPPAWLASTTNPLTDDDGVLRATARAVSSWIRPELFNASVGGVPPRDELLRGHRGACWLWRARVRCLPELWVLGNFQSGLTDLAARLATHPAVRMPAHTSPHFLIESRPWEPFIAAFDRTAETELAGESAHARELVLAVASKGEFVLPWAHTVDVLHPAFVVATRKCWADCADCDRDECIREAHEREVQTMAAMGVPRGVDGEISRFNLPWLLRAIVGGADRARLVVILRHPTDRLYAAFRYFTHYHGKYGGSGPDAFASYVDEQLGAIEMCAREFGRARCALEFEALRFAWEQVFYHCDQVIKSMYKVSLDRWLDAFPRSALHLVHFELYRENPRDELVRLYAFLGLAAGVAEIEPALALAPRRPEPTPPPFVAMLTATRARVDSFFKEDVDAVVALEPRFASWARAA